MSKTSIALVLAATVALGALASQIGERLAGEGGAIGGVIVACLLGFFVGDSLRRRTR